MGVLCRSPDAFSAVLKSLFLSKDDREQGRGVSWVEHHEHICISQNSLRPGEAPGGRREDLLSWQVPGVLPAPGILEWSFLLS